MASKSKIKGNTYERELVNYFKDKGLDCERARGSDGRSLGMEEDVDGYFKLSRTGKKIKWQAKRRRSIPKWLAKFFSIYTFNPNPKIFFAVSGVNETLFSNVKSSLIEPTIIL